MKKIIYSNEKTREISFPLGGIGTGCIGLSGEGRLIDWEIFNRPNKKSSNGFSFFAIKAEDENKVIDTRVLNSDSFFTRTGFEAYPDPTFHSGYGYGPKRTTMAGVPHFPKADFLSYFPFAELNFEYERFPGKVRMTAFNPFIPEADADSSIPAAFFEFEIENTSDKTLSYTLAGVLNNPLPDTLNSFGADLNTEAKFIRLRSRKELAPKDSGELCIATDCVDVSYQEYWFRGKWFDSLQTFWNDFTGNRSFDNRSCKTGGENDSATLAAHIDIPSGEKRTIRFVISWYFPNCVNYWNPVRPKEGEDRDETEKKNLWKNYYTRYFADSPECAVYSLTHFSRLYSETMLFTENLYSSTLPERVLDAVASNLCILKSPTCLRNYDGSFYAFEGCAPHDGSCEGTCLHVWNYAYALPFLFPSLQRSISNNELKYSMSDYGAIHFRIPAPLGRKPDDYFPCADGQMGEILKIYREFKISGDVEWLKGIWSEAKKALEFAWSEKNIYKWDADKDGVMEGMQHHTLDMELFGPNSWITGLYTAALKAAAEMALIVKDKKKHIEYLSLYEKSRKYLNEQLYNGRYFYHKVDVTDKGTLERHLNTGKYGFWGKDVIEQYWNEETGEIKYQIGEGSAVDQTLAQFHADLIGLGEIFDEDKLKSALKTIYEVNFKKSMRDFFNPCRLYAINEEAGVTICTYPEGAKKPKIPVPYAEECMNGFEYQAACQMIAHGMVDEGLEIVNAVRKRYDGEYRNPFNEFECGSNYARSMASYALLNVISGFEYNMYEHFIGFSPMMRFAEKGTFRCFFSLGASQGFVECGPDYIQMKLLCGEFKVRRFRLHKIPRKVYYGGRNIGFEADGNCAVLENSLYVNKQKDIMVIFD